MLPGQRSEIRRIGGADIKSYTARKAPITPGRVIRPGLPGSVSITKITKDPNKSGNNSDSTNKIDADSDDDTQVLDSDDDDKPNASTNQETPRVNDKVTLENSSDDSQSNGSRDKPPNNKAKEQESGPIVLTTDEKLPSEDAFDSKSNEGRSANLDKNKPKEESRMEHTNERIDHPNEQTNNVTDQANHKMDLTNDKEQSNEKSSKINLLKNYRHQRLQARATESSLSQLEKTAISLNKEGAPAFRKNLDDITQSYSPAGEERPAARSRKKKQPNKVETNDASSDRQPASSLMSHSVSSMLGPGSNEVSKMRDDNGHPVAPMGQGPLPMPHPHEHVGLSPGSGSMHGTPPMSMSPGMSPGPEHHKGLMPAAPMPMAPGMPAPAQYPGPPPEGSYGQYPPGKFTCVAFFFI